MKLVLFSDRIYAPEINTQLIDLIGKTQPTIGYISSCPDPSRQYYEQTKQYYAQIGANFTPYVDLESGFDRGYINRAFQADAIHLSGGNTYQFCYWIIQRGLKQRLLDYARSGRVIIGVSAGAIIMTPDISYAKFCGDPNDVNLQELKGLGLVDFCFVPHAEGRIAALSKIIKSSSCKEGILRPGLIAAYSEVLICSDLDLIFTVL